MKRKIFLAIVCLIYLPIVYFLIRSVLSCIDALAFADKLQEEQFNAFMFRKAAAIASYIVLLIANTQLLTGMLYYKTKEIWSESKQIFFWTVIFFVLNICVSIFLLLTDVAQRTFLGISITTGIVGIAASIRHLVEYLKNRK